MAAPSFTEGNLLRVGGHDFHCEDPPRTTPPGQFPVHKNPDLVENYIATIEELRPSRIVELGINRGGSTALISELARPEKLVAIELDEIPVAILTEYVEREGLTSTVRPHYGVDQSDRSRLAEIMRAEFGSTPIDLVFDDASHLYEQSRSSFETIFPLLRPDGVYVIEDWRCQHRYADSVPADANHLSERQQQAIIRRMEALDADRLAPVVPLSRLALELVLARASSTDAVAEVIVGSDWTVVRRGPGPLDAATFRVDDLYDDHFSLLAAVIRP